MTILWHPDPRRVGEVAVLAGRKEPLSRLEPYFAPVAGGRPRPLEDPRLSRHPPLHLFREQGEAVRLVVGDARIVVVANGSVVEAERRFSRDEITDGVVLLLAGRITVVLHRLESIPSLPPSYGLVGESSAMVRLRRQIERMAAGTDAVLLRGDTGTGKELVARAIHDAGPRSRRPFVSVNVAAIPAGFVPTELFGALKGSHSGATDDQPGYFRRADGGTLFLDEIGEASPETQASLLRVLETGEIQPLGAREPCRVDVRVVAATDADLETAVDAGRFRAPLLHRLGGREVLLPPLRRRREDIGRLILRFLHERLTALDGSPVPDPGIDVGSWISARLVSRLALYRWPGNVRELRNAVHQIVDVSHGSARARLPRRLEERMTVPPPPSPAATARSLGEGEVSGHPSRSTSTSLSRYRDPDAVSEAELLASLRSHRWEPAATARQLGVSRASVYGLMERSGIRRASQLERTEIEAAVARLGRDYEALAEELKVSKRGLKIRMTHLGLRGAAYDNLSPSESEDDDL
jgi:DNA-binding NtrC family response regulator